jgi:hypothetical protein
MTEFILKLLGARVDAAGDIAGVRVALQGGSLGAWFAVFTAVLGGVAWWAYFRNSSGLSNRRRAVLFGLRCVFLLLLAILLLRPVLAFTVEGSIRRALLVLIDGSESMGIQDPRTEPEDRMRLGIAVGELPPGATNPVVPIPPPPPGSKPPSRLSVMQAVFTNAQLSLLPRLDAEFEVVPFRFGREAVSLPRSIDTNSPGTNGFSWLQRLGADEPATAIGEALREVVNRKRGQPLAGVLLVTDGANNLGVAPQEAAGQLQRENVPLYVYGVGITSPRDIIVTNLSAPEVAFLNDEVLINVHVRAQGLDGEKAKVYLKVGEEKVDEREIGFSGSGEQIVALRYLPKAPGEFDLTAGVEPREDETEKNNNRAQRSLRVVDRRIKVLLVEETPRWEYRYLHAMLSRDRRVELKTVLYEGDPSITHGEDAPFLPAFPANRDELFRYDLVILGDVDPRRFTRLQMGNLNEFVARFGGAFIMIAGKRHSPHGYRQTPIESLLPVEFEAPTVSMEGEAVAKEPVKLELTTRGRGSTMLQLSDQPGENLRRWGELPSVYWVARVLRGKPGAEVLLVDPNPLRASRFGPMPVVAVQQYGLGQSLYVGTDNTWRWRRNVGDLYYYTFWGQVIQRLSLSHLLHGSRRTQIHLDRPAYAAGERVQVNARLYRAGFEPVADRSVKAFYQVRGDTLRQPVELRPVPDQPGLYRGNFGAPAAGQYEFGVEMDVDQLTPFTVTETGTEFGDTAMNENLLRELAAITGGGFYREENLHELPDRVASRTERILSPFEVELWSSPLYFLLILLVVTTEWVLRKLSYLK